VEDESACILGAQKTSIFKVNEGEVLGMNWVKTEAV